MDITLLIMAIILMVIIISPFLLHHLNQKKTEARLLKELTNLAECENAQITQMEFWRQHYAIGIDEISKKVLYLNLSQEKEEKIVINLSEVDRCLIDAVSRVAKNKTGNVTVTERLDLVFIYIEKSEKSLPFYNSSEFISMDNERTLIDKWFTIIKSNLNNVREK